MSFLPTLKGEKNQPAAPCLYWESYEKGGKRTHHEKSLAFRFMLMRLYHQVFKFEHEWLRVDATLADGSQLRLSAGEDFRRKHKPVMKKTAAKTAEATAF